jgi:hypothetical protein
MRRAGLVDEQGLPTNPRAIVCLAGKKPSVVKARLKQLGFELQPGGGGLVVIRNQRTTTRISEVWRYNDPNSNTVHFVRIDEFGHGGNNLQNAGSSPHYHVDSVDRTQQGLTPQGQPITKNGRPVMADEAYQDGQIRNRVTHDDQHTPNNQPIQRTPPPPLTQAEKAAYNNAMDNWANDTHLPINPPLIL